MILGIGCISRDSKALSFEWCIKKAFLNTEEGKKDGDRLGDLSPENGPFLVLGVGQNGP